MYYVRGIVFGLALLSFVVMGMYVALRFGLGAEIELIAYIFIFVILAILGFKFKSKTNFSLIQLMQPENIKYVYFPFGISTVMAISQAFFTFANEGDSFVFWVIPLGVVGQGLNLSNSYKLIASNIRCIT